MLEAPQVDSEERELIDRSYYRLLLNRIAAKTATVGVIGLGYIGLPLALASARAGFATIGFELDVEKIDQLNKGHSYIRHIKSADVKRGVESGRLFASGDFNRLRDVDAIIICVPTPVTKNYEPDISFIVKTALQIEQHLRPGQLIVLESTTYPGTTTGVLRDILQRSKLKSGEDFFLAYSPEREDPGNVNYSTAEIPRVLGGDGLDAMMAAKALYDAVVVATVTVSTPETAEAVKLTENIFRCVNIALVNELKIVFARMGVDIWEVIDAAKTKPFGFMPFYPGPGVGGHCIQADPYYLIWRAREFNISARLVELACEINRLLPEQVTEGIARAIDAHLECGLKGSRILILGVAYKKNIEDIRESPALRIMELLEARGAEVFFHDPYVPVIPPLPESRALTGRAGVALDVDALLPYHAVVITTDHDSVDYAGVVANSRLVIDTRNACARRDLVSETIVKL